MNEGFSIGLGLLDCINPILYTLFFINIIKGLTAKKADEDMIKVLKTGAAMSLTAGYMIAFGKVLVGFNLFSFFLPIPLLYIVDTGFLVTGVTLFLIYKKKTYKTLPSVIKISVPVAFAAAFIFTCISGGANAGAELIAATGAILTYATVAAMAAKEKKRLPMVLALAPIITTALLVPYSMSVNLNEAAPHWVIEAVNIAGLALLYLGSVLLFSKPRSRYTEPK